MGRKTGGGGGAEIVRRNLLRPATNILERRGPTRLWALPRFNNNFQALLSLSLPFSLSLQVSVWVSVFVCMSTVDCRFAG